jgi:hypothetical protein
MAKKIDEEQSETVTLLSVSVFCDRFISNKHYRFHLEKKYEGQELSEQDWKGICKKEKIEL